MDTDCSFQFQKRSQLFIRAHNEAFPVVAMCVKKRGFDSPHPLKVTVTANGIEGDGTPIHSEWKGKFDGNDYEVTGDPDADKRSYKKMNDRTLMVTAKKGNEIVGQGLIVVSADGKRQDLILRSSPGKMSVYSEKGKDKKKEKMTEKAAEKEFRNNALYDKE